jgi:hypothetical protein
MPASRGAPVTHFGYPRACRFRKYKKIGWVKHSLRQHDLMKTLFNYFFSMHTTKGVRICLVFSRGKKSSDLNFQHFFVN